MVGKADSLFNRTNNSAPEILDGDQPILFSSNRDGNFEIYKMNADGTDQQRLTNSPESESGGRWSPNGQKILYIKSIVTALQIWVMNADGSNQTLVSDATGVQSRASWSPDGQKILFTKGTTFNGSDTSAK